MIRFENSLLSLIDADSRLPCGSAASLMSITHLMCAILAANILVLRVAVECRPQRSYEGS